ncbi:microtubule-associated protein 10-like isoform X2 [Dreissena polymorpha]|uniref:Microtubule-associated protein 10 n=1 Tax=Dreissena polymorpha TaxID=45954 RepID=A0A9D4R4E8_DREPO|nr:microtubule-associated protein 10-like isoform X2 [Dreissena polymorpha]KAH3854549.1 hypothetical protein DPMN_097092 [Dreissena polymorpha]
MASAEESLFSLELVVEKLYLPYVTCRFPAVAFRLLDFPTILISHVEKGLADGIKRKISIDPYFRVPNQFAELQDKNGNFMIKKGKSCLFKISVETLSLHLTNTPLYIMVIDEYPDVPKLLGNSSLALNEVMDGIKGDIKKNGHTVPSVHGDKGLFKIYSLMGKEIGYMIMGFRLLSLGPGLISHLPPDAFAKRTSENQYVKTNEQMKPKKSVIEEVIEAKQHQEPLTAYQNVKKQKLKDLNSTRDMAINTEIEKCDVLLQTVEMEKENINIELNEKAQKILKSIETQTEQRKRNPKFAMQVVKEDSESDNDIILNPNMYFPPPLFYNSKAEPGVKIERDTNAYYGYSSTFDDATLEDWSEDENLAKESKESDFKQNENIPTSQVVKEEPRLHDARTVVISNIKSGNQFQNQMPGGLNLAALASSEPVFPLLTALLTELSKIQNPMFVNEAVQQVNQAKAMKVPQKEKHSVVHSSRTEEIIKDVSDLSENVSRARQKKKVKKTHRGSYQPVEGVQKNKGWLRKEPEVEVKKTKLVFGLTNTQRLRLAKQNPNWLESAEKDEKAVKLQRQKQKQQKEQEPDIETGNLSDTYTEVRRLAAKELEKATLGKSQLAAEQVHTKRHKKKMAKSRDNSPAKANSSKSRSRSPKSSKSKKLKVQDESDGEKTEGQENNQQDDEYTKPAREKMDSAADSIPSSRLEVHIPSARAYESDDHENTFTDSFEDESVVERKDTNSKFPGFSKGDDTLPESIKADEGMSQNTTIDDDSPLESTRLSRNLKQAPQTGESVFKSTEDYDTKQFHSTDEPELQNLMSGDEKGDTLPTPNTDRSVRSKSPSLGGYSPTMTAGSTVTNTNRLSMKFEVLNPKASHQSPMPSLRRSQQLKVDNMNARPTPTDTPRSRSSQSSPKQPTPRARKQMRERRLEFKKESIHTESVSSYMPSESENILSLLSDGSYSDDFHMSSEKEDSSKVSIPELPKRIPQSMLGFTIH